jgi:lipoate synthase
MLSRKSRYDASTVLVTYMVTLSSGALCPSVDELASTSLHLSTVLLTFQPCTRNCLYKLVVRSALQSNSGLASEQSQREIAEYTWHD